MLKTPNPTERTHSVWWLCMIVVTFLASSAMINPSHAGYACLSNPCIYGVCIDDLNSTYSCYCIDGYTGVHCQTNWDECWSNPCRNGGTCIDGIASYNCTCPDGFLGLNCEENFNECQSNPCQNGGFCQDRDNAFYCTCVQGYEGEFCEIDIAICNRSGDRCLNGAACIDGPGLEFTCDCTGGYEGFLCDSEINECASSPCQNGAICIDKFASYVCACPMGYSGTNCEEQILICASSPCANQALCLMEKDSPTCYCVPDFHGELCELQYDECRMLGPEPRCVNGATCIDGVDDYFCMCAPKFSGENCECLILADEGALEGLDCNYTMYVTIEEATFEESFESTSPQDATSIAIQETLPTSASQNTLDTSDYVSSDYITSSDFVSMEATTVSVMETTIPTSQAAPRVSTLAPEFSLFFTQTPTTSSTRKLSGEDQAFPLTTPVPINSIGDESPDVMQNCDDTVCTNGGTCSLTPNGVRCLCEFRFTGQFCNIPVSIQNAAFSKESFLRHVIYRRNDTVEHAITRSSESTELFKQISVITMRFKAKLTSREGLILLATTEGDEGSHYVALFLHKGLLQFQFSCGLQTMLLSEIEGTVNNGFELHIKVQLNFNQHYSHCNASLHVNDTLAMSGEQPTWLGKVYKAQYKEKADGTDPIAVPLAAIKYSWVHMGGRPFKAMHTLTHNISRYHGFTGCVYELEINNKPTAIFDNAEDAYLIYECTSLACLSSPCRNGAVCVEKDEDNVFFRQQYNPDLEPSSSNASSWSCKCAFGYMGKTCDRSICDNNPCRFGGTCITFPESGYLCLCPYGKHGHFCEHDLDILQPSFFGSIKGLASYVAYPIAFPIEDRLEFSFKIIPTTSAQISLLAFIGQPYNHQEQSDHFSISFIQGFILVTWNLGSGPRRIFTQQPLQVQPTRPTTIHVGRNGKTAWLSIEGKMNISGNSPGGSTKLNVFPYLYIGGHEGVNFSSLPHDLPLHSGFQGCIFDIRLVAGPVHIPLQHIGGMRGRSIGQCGTKECHRHACQNNGACLQHGSTFTCICQQDWNGILCSQKANPCDEKSAGGKCAIGSDCFPLVSGGYECDCPYGMIGTRCETKLKHLSDVSFSGRRSYLAVRWPAGDKGLDWIASYRENEVHYYEQIVQHSHITPHNHSILLKSIRELDKINDVLKVLPETRNDTEIYDDEHVLLPRSESYRQLKIRQLTIELQIRPLSEKGLILFVPTFDSDAREQGFISISLQGGVVEYRVSSGRSQSIAVVRSNHVLATGEWHSIRVVKYGKRLTLWVEGKSSSIAGFVQREEYMSLTSKLYLGGLPDLSEVPYDALTGYPTSFRGCIRNVILNGTRITLNGSSIVASRNINDCDGTPCGGDLCANGGICLLDEYSKPRCKCSEYSKGTNCEIQESCEITKCRNNGQCMANGRCSCSGLGWTGQYCEIATTKYSSLGFNERSYILIPSQKIKMKDKRNDNGGGSLTDKSPIELQLSFNISTLHDGVLVWATDTTGRYLGVGIRHGLLVVVSNMLEQDRGTTANNVTNESHRRVFVADGDWHHIMLETRSTQLRLHVDGYVIFAGALVSTLPTFHQTKLLQEITYLGGFPEQNVYDRTQGHFKTFFTGCMKHILLGNQLDEEIDFTELDGANINECAV
ncbi:protein eyes shut [Anopheles nili]|uniref:protein eyes shut n=1 Tax=Anopheles nili TaxID=185578 RepID=UPI00237A4CAE|nr:protein eyes shut [Anopheles nili]